LSGAVDGSGKGGVEVGKAADEMIPHLDSADRGVRRYLGLSIGELLYRVGKVLLVAVLFVLFFLLGQAMVRNRFFQGGRYHANGSVGQ
jgi:hypothetical protein